MRRLFLVLAAATAATACITVLQLGGEAHAEDGVPLVFDIHPGGEPALVFVHGWACDRTFWSAQVQPFVKSHTVVLMDLAGHGQSGDEREVWSIEAFSGDVQAVIEELDLEQVIVIGHSMGGYVALDVARRMPDTVLAVVGVDTLHDADREFSEDELDAALASFEEDWNGTMGSMLPNMLSPETDESVALWILGRVDAAHQGPALATLRGFPQLDLPALFENADVPIRCINSVPGEAPANQPTETLANQRYADFGVVYMERVGHYPMLERPDVFNVKLAEVLADILYGP